MKKIFFVIFCFCVSIIGAQNSYVAPLATPVSVTNGGTGTDLSAGGAVGDHIQAASSTTFSRLAAGAAGTILRSTGTGSLTAFSTATYPNTVAQGGILYATASNTFSVSTVFTFNGSNQLQFTTGSNSTASLLNFLGSSGNGVLSIKIFNPGTVGAGYFSSNSNPIYFGTDGTCWATMQAKQLYIGGTTIPTANLHISAGTATANTAPLKFTSGTNLTTAEAGAWEYDGTNFFATRTGTTREGVLSVSAVNTVTPTLQNRTLTVNINGTTYYITAKTTND